MLANVSAVGTLAVMPTAPAPHVLVVDDEPIVRDVLTRYLTRAGYRVSDAVDGEQALEAISAGHPDVVLLDLMLPRVNGLDVLRTVRRDSDVPVIVLSARSSEVERIDGLRLGADDYVVKPYSPGEVVARVRGGAAPRRRDRDGAAVRRRDHRSRGARGEAGRPGGAHHPQGVRAAASAGPPSRPRLQPPAAARAGLGLRVAGATDTVTVHIRRLRAKIELEPSAPRHLVTVHGVGYRFEP